LAIIYIGFTRGWIGVVTIFKGFDGGLGLNFGISYNLWEPVGVNFKPFEWPEGLL